MTQSTLGSVAGPTSKHAGKAANIALWVVQILLALAFLGVASGKLRGAPEMLGLFETIGIGQWFRYLTGLLEVLGAILIVVPRTKFFGAVLLGSIMVGAVLTHLVILHDAPIPAATLLLLSGIVAWGRREDLKPVRARLGRVTP